MTDMNDKQVLKLALEALETVVADVKTTPTAYEAHQQAITAIKKVLAQSEQKPEAWQVKYRDDEGIPQIAWLPHPVHSKSPLAKRPYTKEPLYTTPPQRSKIAFEEALAQEQEPVAMRYDYDGYGWLYIDNGSGSNWREKIKNAEPLYTAPPQPKPEQEPVEWGGDCVLGHCGSPAGCEDSNCCRANYTAPPQRTWVGLTDEERDHFEGLHLYAARNQVEAWIEGVPAFIDAIESKLREKNGG